MFLFFKGSPFVTFSSPQIKLPQLRQTTSKIMLNTKIDSTNFLTQTTKFYYYIIHLFFNIIFTKITIRDNIQLGLWPKKKNVPPFKIFSQRSHFQKKKRVNSRQYYYYIFIYFGTLTVQISQLGIYFPNKIIIVSVM